MGRKGGQRLPRPWSNSKLALAHAILEFQIGGALAGGGCGVIPAE